MLQLVRQRSRRQLRPLQVQGVRGVPAAAVAAVVAATATCTRDTACASAASVTTSAVAAERPCVVLERCRGRHGLRGVLQLVRQQPRGQLRPLQVQGMRGVQVAAVSFATLTATRACILATIAPYAPHLCFHVLCSLARAWSGGADSRSARL